jgi:O-antigen/teichoic acid export membrane protein
VPGSRFSFILGAASNWFAFAATLAVSFFLTPYLIHSLGKPRYDVWCVVEAILAYFTLLDMGIAVCLVRFVAKHRAVADIGGLNRMASSCLALFLVAGGIALAVGAPILFALAPALEAKLGGSGDVLPFMLLMLANLAFTLPASVFPSILDGLEAFTAKSLIRLAALAVRTVGIIVAVNAGEGLFPLAIVYTAVNIVEHSAFALQSWRRLPGLRFAVRFVDRATLKEVRTFSVDAFLAMLAGRITVQTGAIVVGAFLPGGQVTFFATAARLVDYAKTLLRTITTTLTPGVSAMEARGDHAGIAQLFCNATRWLLYAALPVQIGFILFGKAFLSRWVGAEFIAGSYPALVVMSFTLSIGIAQSVASRMLYGLGRLKWFARAALVEAALNVGLMLALIGNWGVEGVAIAVAVPNVFFCLFVLGFTLKQLGISWRSYATAWLRPLGLMLLPVAIWLGLGNADASWPSIFGKGFAGMVPYVIAVAITEGFAAKIYTRFSKRVLPKRMKVAPSSIATS